MKTAHAAPEQLPSPHAIATAPQPRTPLADSLRRLRPRPTTPDHGDLARLVAELAQVAVWTARGGGWQEHASFLLATTDGRWHIVAFNEPGATELVTRLRTLPEFDTDLLLDVIGCHSRRIVTLWRSPHL